MAEAAAVDLAAMTSELVVETAPAVMRDGVQRPAVLGLRWWKVASAAAMTGSEAAAAMALGGGGGSDGGGGSGGDDGAESRRDGT